jgi:hypothetical protein
MYVNIQISASKETVKQLESSYRPNSLDAVSGVHLIEVMLKDILSGKVDAVIKLGVGTANVAPDATGGAGVVTYDLT